MELVHDAYTLWAAADEHGDAYLDDTQLPLLLLRRAAQPPQLRTLLRLRHVVCSYELSRWLTSLETN